MKWWVKIKKKSNTPGFLNRTTFLWFSRGAYFNFPNLSAVNSRKHLCTFLKIFLIFQKICQSISNFLDISFLIVLRLWQESCRNCLATLLCSARLREKKTIADDLKCLRTHYCDRFARYARAMSLSLFQTRIHERRQVVKEHGDYQRTRVYGKENSAVADCVL